MHLAVEGVCIRALAQARTPFRQQSVRVFVTFPPARRCAQAVVRNWRTPISGLGTGATLG